MNVKTSVPKRCKVCEPWDELYVCVCVAHLVGQEDIVKRFAYC